MRRNLLLFAKTEFSNCLLDWLISPGSTKFKMAASLGSVFLQASFFSLWDYVIIETHTTSTPECSRKFAQCGRAKACAHPRLTALRFGQKSKAVVQIQGVSSGFDIMYLALADRNMLVRYGLEVIWAFWLGAFDLWPFDLIKSNIPVLRSLSSEGVQNFTKI